MPLLVKATQVTSRNTKGDEKFPPPPSPPPSLSPSPPLAANTAVEDRPDSPSRQLEKGTAQAND